LPSATPRQLIVAPIDVDAIRKDLVAERGKRGDGEGQAAISVPHPARLEFALRLLSCLLRLVHLDLLSEARGTCNCAGFLRFCEECLLESVCLEP
jgi:hypothetical protein